MSWASSNRRSRLPKDWPKRVAATRERAGGMCEAAKHDPRCDGFGGECDHHNRGDDHSLENLRWLNTWCHKAKTAREAAASRANKPSVTRPTPRHPGLL